MGDLEALKTEITAIFDNWVEWSKRPFDTAPEAITGYKFKFRLGPYVDKYVRAYNLLVADENYKNKLIPSYEGHNVVDIFINNYCGRPHRYTDNRTIEHGYLHEYFDSQELFDQFVRAEEILREIALIKQAEVTNGT